MLIVLSGSSGSGKNTIIREIQRLRPSVKVMKSCTTRKKRDEGDNAYYFLDEAEFREKIENGDFFEFEEVHKGILYGILKSSLEEVKKDKVYMKDVDVHGSIKLKSVLKDKAKLVYLDVPKEVLRDRILKRGETEQSAELRLSRYDHEKSFIDKYDLVIENKSLDESVRAIINEFDL